MTETWNFSALEDRLCHQFDAEHSKKTVRSLKSIIENQEFCRFHYGEICRLQNEKEAMGNSIDRILTKRVRNQDEHFITAIRAHTNALLRCLHSNSDLLAHFIFFCFEAKSNKHINLKVIKALPTLCSVEAESLKSLLREYEDNISGTEHIKRVKSDYWYLDALINHTKHWSNILPRLTYNLKKEDKDIYQWDFEKFTYKEGAYPKQSVLLFIEREYDRQSELLPKIIREVDLLNAKFFEN